MIKCTQNWLFLKNQNIFKWTTILFYKCTHFTSLFFKNNEHYLYLKCYYGTRIYREFNFFPQTIFCRQHYKYNHLNLTLSSILWHFNINQFFRGELKEWLIKIKHFIRICKSLKLDSLFIRTYIYIYTWIFNRRTNKIKIS